MGGAAFKSLVVVAKLEPVRRPHEVRWQRLLPEIVQYRGCQLYSLAGFQAGPEIAALAVILNSRTAVLVRERRPSSLNIGGEAPNVLVTSHPSLSVSGSHALSTSGILSRIG